MEYAENKKALIVDDDPVNRKLLKGILKRENYLPLLAENGAEAVEIFKEYRPDLVLMDIVMPVMNGYEAAREIKKLGEEHFVPIIFLTAVTDEEALTKCVESGGDDFLTKPYNRMVLKAKINAMERIRGLYTTLNAQKKKLEAYQSDIQHELEFAEHIFQNITSRGTLDLPYLKFWTSTMSMSMFNGDLLLAARKPSGGIHLVLCDFTGHGLPAAVGALPVSEVFVAMTHRGFSLAEIIVEINRKLRQELPTGFFCAAGFADIDVTQGTLSVWNGGLPELILVDRKKGFNKRISSNHLPLGIANKTIKRGDFTVTEITPELQLFMYTDGVIEAVNEDGAMFGDERLDQCFCDAKDSNEVLELLKRRVHDFRGDAEQHDDISFVQLDCQGARLDIPVEVQSVGPQGVMPAEWKVNFNLSAGILKDINPVPMILNMLTHMRLAEDHRKRIFTVLTELYTNAMDHGLLRLSSDLKSTPEGFANYYVEREKRLDALTEGQTHFTIQQAVTDDGYVLRLRVTDTGQGFDIPTLSESPTVDTHKLVPSGRGIKLIKSLCRSLDYQDGGRTAEAVYYLGDK